VLCAGLSEVARYRGWPVNRGSNLVIIISISTSFDNLIHFIALSYKLSFNISLSFILAFGRAPRRLPNFGVLEQVY
jgi:hypothetical protein